MTHPAPKARPYSPLPALAALTRRELVRYLRQPSRPIAALATAIILWVFLASGLSGSLATNAYPAFLLPGVAAISILFGSIFAAISLIEDRHSGFAQSVLVSPAPAWTLTLAKILATALINTAQAALLLLGAPLAGVPLSPAALPAVLAALALMSVAIASLSLACAWRADSTQGFHAVMNALLMPMWVLSGSVFPLEGSAGWLRTLMLANPLTWTLAAARHALDVPGADALPAGPAGAWAATVAFAGLTTIAAILVVGRPPRARNA